MSDTGTNGGGGGVVGGAGGAGGGPAGTGGDQLAAPGNTPAGSTLEVEKPPAPAPDPARTFSAEEIEAARKQERDKLYDTIEKERREREAVALQVAELTREREERLATEETERQEREAAAARAAEEELSVRELLNKREAEWQEQLAAERAERERLAATLEMEQRFKVLDDYRRQRIEAEQDTLMPELVDLVGGNTEEEIENSIAFVKDRTARILEQVQAASASNFQQQRGVAPTGAPPTGPIEDMQNTETLTAEQIRNMPLDEYNKRRPQLLAAASRHARDQGLYG